MLLKMLLVLILEYKILNLIWNVVVTSSVYLNFLLGILVGFILVGVVNLLMYKVSER